ncbi:glycosyltransferase [Thermoflexus sp.]|uniref:glycosyltransferase n=1 Tax=Thermoflexus sp. TaxID=1969742 RepID=UPI0025F17933|nr:glycosyltransferase [Thermoflexus sp.]MCS6964647.1 glycosyltransferase [Thermoflexus sp.]MCS7350275.1 glycosyltransferase [Thermoflexus sp.]MDW8179726.1 glycosyltransferase [Anaerolineae bacterium]MDW8184202.1 glycosyltransferase [Anaerolineae bacterium]
MSTTIRYTLIIPCYNEAEGIPHLREALQPAIDRLMREGGVEVIFVDDGSTDGTGDLLRAAFADAPLVRILTHSRNRGLGAALRTGFQAARGEIVITTDSDGTYPFEEIPHLLRLMSEDVDVVTASPYHPGGGIEGVPPWRQLFSFGASFLYRLILRSSVRTYTALFRAYRRRVLEEISIEADGYVAVAEIMAKAIRRGFRIAEYPAVLRVRRFGHSKMKILRTILAHLQLMARLIRPERLSPPIPTRSPSG